LIFQTRRVQPFMKRKSKKNVLTVVLTVLIVASVAAIGYMIFFHREEPIGVKKKKSVERQVESKSNTFGDRVSKAGQSAEKDKSHPRHPTDGPVPKPTAKEKTIIAKIVPPYSSVKKVAIIIDDIGYDMQALRDLLDIDAQITFAVLPMLAHSREAAETAHRLNREVLLHLPMEPKSYPKDRPGAGALFKDMSQEEVLLQLEKNLASVPHAVGVNNHMGSGFMSDEEKLTAVFRHLKKNNLFFIDSRTSPDSQTRAASQKTDLTVASRRIFLDNERDYEKIYRVLMDVADQQQGGAPLILIGHPYPETIRALRDACKVFRERGVSIVPVSRLIGRQSTQERS